MCLTRNAVSKYCPSSIVHSQLTHDKIPTKHAEPIAANTGRWMQFKGTVATGTFERHISIPCALKINQRVQRGISTSNN